VTAWEGVRSFDVWLEEQNWTDEAKDAVRDINDNQIALGLNPLTRGQIFRIVKAIDG